MLNPIYFLADLPWEVVAEEVAKLEKCELSGIIKKIEIKNDNECLNSIKILVSGDNGYYEVSSSKTTDAGCSHDSIHLLYWDKALPKVGDKIDLLIDKSGYYVISDKNVGEGTYTLLAGNKSDGNTEICESNSSFVEQNSNYLYYGIIICVLIIIGIIVNMIRSKKKK